MIDGGKETKKKWKEAFRHAKNLKIDCVSKSFNLYSCFLEFSTSKTEQINKETVRKQRRIIKMNQKVTVQRRSHKSFAQGLTTTTVARGAGNFGF